MRVGVDASCWANVRGYGRFTRELLRTMIRQAPDCEWLLFGDPATLEQVGRAVPSGVTAVPVALDASPAEAASADGHRSPRDMLRMTRAVRRLKPDVFFAPSVYTYFPVAPGPAIVVVIHDTIAERFPHLTLPSARARLFWRAKVRLALLQAKLVLTISEYSARQLESVLGVGRARIRVVGEAPAAAYAPSESAERVREAARSIGLAEGDKWFVYVGGFNPHKRLDIVIDAHAALVRAGVPCKLVLVGPSEQDVFHADTERLRHQIEAAGTQSLVHWPGFVEDERLRHLLSGAQGLLLVSEMEGFGLPAVEAAACGTPVIGTVESPLPELLEGGGFWVKPGDTAGVTNAMRVLACDQAERDRLGRRARERAAAMTWDAAAAATLLALREAAA